MSRGEAPPDGVVGHWVSESGRDLRIDETGAIDYDKPGLKVEGMPMNGWESAEGVKPEGRNRHQGCVCLCRPW